jgi:hypothetical protein
MKKSGGGKRVLAAKSKQQANAGCVHPKLLYTKVGRIITFQASKTRSTGNNSTIPLVATSAFAETLAEILPLRIKSAEEKN